MALIEYVSPNLFLQALWHIVAAAAAATVIGSKFGPEIYIK